MADAEADAAAAAAGPGGGAESIRVFCRVRPSKRPSGFFTLAEDGSGVVDFALPPDVDRDLVNNSKSSHKFRFDGLFDVHAGQDEIFDGVARDAVDAALDGFNATVFAYGQTGSGKTFTITGGPERYQDRGLIPRSLQRIFVAMKERTDVQYTAYVSYLEIYNESGYDLLDPSQESKALEELPRVSLMEDEDGNVHLRGLSMHMASSEEEALNLLFLGDTNRAIAETPMNMASSRSHCVFSISLEAREEGSSVVRRSKLHLVDLAGSERVHKTNAVGQLFKEATFINKSLHYLELVIVALHEQRKGQRTHIPYRNSIMTSVLRDSLGGNCKTTMIATINPELEHTNESISTCRFAQRVARVQNAAMVNEVQDPAVLISQLKTKMSALEQEVSYLRAQKDGGDGPGGDGAAEEVTDGDISRIRAAARAWVDGPDGLPFTTFGAATLARVRVAFEAIRALVLEARGGGRGGRGRGPAGPGRGGTLGAGAGVAAEATAARPSGEDGDGSAPPPPSGGEAAGPGRVAAHTEEVEDEGETALASALRSEVKRLKAHAAQRETEMALLVSLVKQLKAGAAPNTAPFASHAASSAPPTVPGAASTPSGSGIVLENGSVVPAAVSGGQVPMTLRRWPRPSHARPSPFPPPPSPPPTAQVLSDRDKAFEIFRQLFPKHDAVEDNKALLKHKYDAAKAEAERVNVARGEMNRLKGEIERGRVEAAMANIVEGKLDGDAEGTAAAGEWCAGRGEQGENMDQPPPLRLPLRHTELANPFLSFFFAAGPDEARLRSDLDRQKAAYKESFQRLRDLKGEIEHIQRLLEAGRLKMQADFESWFSAVLLKANRATQAEAERLVGEKGAGPAAGLGTPGVPAFPAVHQQPLAHPAAPFASTGSAQADADIAAFYKAKEELLRRAKLAGGGT
jgi:kinesin family protein 6/9